MNVNAARNAPVQLMDGIIALLNDSFRWLFGGVLDQTIVGRVTWCDLMTGTFVLLLTLLANWVLLRRLGRKVETKKVDASSTWQARIAGTVGPPLSLLIWICGIYAAITPLRLKLPSDEAWQSVGAGLDKFFDLGAFAVVFWLFFRFTRLLEAHLAALAAKMESNLADLFVPLAGKSLRVIVPVVGAIFAMPLLDLPVEYNALLTKGTSILLIAAVAVLGMQAVSVGEKGLLARYDIKVADNLQARKVHTQVRVISKTLDVVIAIFAAASILMMFEEVRRFGTSILASAGVAGIIIGFAAQKTIANLFAGFQIAMTQPIRLDDVVIVEGEWGRVEEITLTYVIVHIWDDRRLVIPLSYFIEKPFQNWTRTSADLLGSVLIWTDYSLPLDEIRKVLKGIIESNPLWDKRFWNLQVTDANERAMQIRVLATSSDSTRSFDLRCDIREKLISYIQQNHPQSLPQLRATLGGGGTKLAHLP